MIEETHNWPLARFIVPAFPKVNIFSRYAGRMTSLGIIMVATAANKLWGWRVEVIDENNYKGPRDEAGLPDHAKLQQERPALVVGFYCGLTSTMERAFDLADFYHRAGAIVLAGGWHVHYCPEEALDNNIDVVVHGDGEIVIKQLLAAIRDGAPIDGIPGISFSLDGRKFTNPPAMLEVACLDELPYPDFGLLRHVRKIRNYPIGRIRGCGKNCEFCSVKGKARWASAEYLFGTVNWLVETRGARNFFIVDDRLEEDLEGTMEFFRLIREKYGNKLHFTVQIRLEAAKNIEFLENMKAAGVDVSCVGYESPVDEDLRSMHKGYLAANMLEWTRILRRYFWVHGMFIFGYPSKDKISKFGALELKKRFQSFIRKAHLDSIQVLHPVPLVGTALRKRLQDENRIIPQELVSLRRYDGSFVCFRPIGMTIEDLQVIPFEIMRWFYSPFSFLRIPLRTIIFPFDFLIRGWWRWHRDWLRDIVKYGGHLLVQRWSKQEGNQGFLRELKRFGYHIH
ncbi:MAG: cobalamin-dependent protein [Candidatus Staskawiczbacteria bacterium]